MWVHHMRRDLSGLRSPRGTTEKAERRVGSTDKHGYHEHEEKLSAATYHCLPAHRINKTVQDFGDSFCKYACMSDRSMIPLRAAQPDLAHVSERRRLVWSTAVVCTVSLITLGNVTQIFSSAYTHLIRSRAPSRPHPCAQSKGQRK